MRTYSKLITLAFTLSILFGCTTPVSHSDIKLTVYDKDTDYGVDEKENGFGLTIYYSRYQFIPESNAIVVACKSMLTSIAWEIADKKRRKIAPINEQRIRMSMGRNGLSGISSCQASAVVEWAK
jgi:hypothetical protein